MQYIVWDVVLRRRVICAIDETRSSSKYHKIRLPNGDLVVPFRTLCETVAKCCVIVNVRSASRRRGKKKKKKERVSIYIKNPKLVLL